jgi:hypothetical protein
MTRDVNGSSGRIKTSKQNQTTSRNGYFIQSELFCDGK